MMSAIGGGGGLPNRTLKGGCVNSKLYEVHIGYNDNSLSDNRVTVTVFGSY